MPRRRISGMPASAAPWLGGRLIHGAALALRWSVMTAMPGCEALAADLGHAAVADAHLHLHGNRLAVLQHPYLPGAPWPGPLLSLAEPPR
jgi:hypothetical protein